MGYKTVYLVDNVTRIILPDIQWSARVLESLEKMGHEVKATDEDPENCHRDDAEKQRMHDLLDSTGL